MERNTVELYNLWVKNAVEDIDIVNELKAIKDDQSKIADAFFQDLAFGTGGLRGIIGAGTNRLNVYTIGKASQGLANYIRQNFKQEDRKVAISYDSRIKSDLFAKIAAEVFAANGIKVFIYTELMPVPALSFATRELKCAAGVMITASHNPSMYNGYKVYGTDGCQITTQNAKAILSEIKKINEFTNVKRVSFDDGLKQEIIQYIPDEIYQKYISCVKNESILYGDNHVKKDVDIIYTPLNGTGLKPVLKVLKESGYSNIRVVKEQEKPDGTFPTCPFPNPEVRDAMELGVTYAQKYNADLLLATDPDCDRVGIAIKNDKGKFELISANETGMLLLDFISKQRISHNNMPKDPVFMKTIVTIDMAERIAKKYHLQTINTLTGFKFIGEQIGILEKQGRLDSFIFGFEESYGYLSGTYVRDKDGVNAALLICDMFAYYKTKNISLYKKLQDLYKEFGYCLNTQHTYKFDGPTGMDQMNSILDNFRNNMHYHFANRKILHVNDYLKGIDGLPKSNVLKFFLDKDCSVVIRPSGTEPKLKIYISVSAESRFDAQQEELKIFNFMKMYIS